MEGKKHPGGRPTEYTEERVKEINNLFDEYIENTPLPIIAEFAYMNRIRRQSLYEYPEFSDTRKRAIDKKEAVLERQALEGEVNATMAIFSLKQLGWSDKKEVELSGDVKETLKMVPLSEIMGKNDSPE